MGIRHVIFAIIAGGLLSVSLGACGEDDYLEGSISDELNLDFDELRLHKQGGFLLVEYVHRTFEASETTCKLAADVTALPEDHAIEGLDFLQRVTLRRSTVQYSVFPQVREGKLELKEFEFEHGGSVEGTFYVLFENDLTLEGGFSGKLVEIQIE
ncbi:MAG: hypothetical protein JRH20_17590 [Deltaproteobacteria bacterium]|nr:hypothetical protein [Deltaproteobacteria bacterium]